MTYIDVNGEKHLAETPKAIRIFEELGYKKDKKEVKEEKEVV